MKKINKVLKVLMINAIICSLMQNPFVSNAMAAEKGSSDINAKDIINVVNAGLNVAENMQTQMFAMKQQQAALEAAQRMKQQLGPFCVNPKTGAACYTTPGKYFPECTLPASISNMPANACGNATPNPVQIGEMIGFQDLSNQWVNYYDQMSNKASNSKYPVGMACLVDKQKALDSQLIEMSNSLQRLQDRLNQDKQIFRDNNKKLLEDMNAANDELFGMGGASKNNLNMKTQDFAKFFSQNCQSVIGKENLKNGTAGGFNGILQGLSSTNKAAADFNLNKAAIENDLRREVDRISADINKGGIDFWSGDVKTTGFASIEAAVTKQSAEFQASRKRLTDELKELGYTPPPMDKNFTADMEEFIASSGDFFKKKYVNDCVTGADKGIAIPVDDILKSIEQKSTRSGGTVTTDYRVALKKILESDAMMDEKMASIKALEAQYPGISITYKNESQASVTESPYTLFMRTIEKCEQRFAQDDTFSSKGSKGVSFQKKVDRGRAALQELKNLNDGFAGRIRQSITEQVLNCNGKEFKSGNSCNEDTMDSSKGGFCVTHASQCSNQILGCYGEVNKHVQTRKTKMENLSKVFNANVAAMVARSNTLYEQQKAAITNITQLIQSKFPGTNFELPKDMFVSMPELKKDAYGVEMAADGDMKAFLDGENSMPAKIDKLKEIFKKQRETVNKEIGDYIALQENAMKEQRSRWEKLAGKCETAVDASSKEIAKMNAEREKAQREEDAKVGKFCKKYNSISQNPIGACNKAKDLAELSDAISARLSSQATTLTEQYAAACDGFNNQNDELPDACSAKKESELSFKEKAECAAGKKKGSARLPEPKPIRLSTLCSTAEKDDKDFIAAVLTNFSATDREKLKDATTLDELKSKIESEKIADNKFVADISDFIADAKGEKICQKLTSKVKPASSDELKRKKVELAVEEKKSPVDAGKVAGLKLDIKEAEDKAKEGKAEFDAISLQLVAISAAPDPTSTVSKYNEVKNIGEQMEGPCDMQSNTSVAKSGGDFLESFDNSILGASRQR
ncbi:MAG: hypothetical protein WC635_15415 [Bacteriovorax sp.]|jgi:hypothetical protein